VTAKTKLRTGRSGKCGSICERNNRIFSLHNCLIDCLSRIPPIQSVRWIFFRSLSDRNVKLKVHSHLVPKL